MTACEVRLLFVTDLHGSTAVLSKAMTEATNRSVDLLVVGGDLEGKYLLFIAESTDRISWEDPLSGVSQQGPKSDLPHVLDTIATYGGYGVVVPEDWDHTLQSRAALDDLLLERARLRLKEWITRLGEFATCNEIAVHIMPGNDDPWEFDNIILSHKELGYLDENVCELNGFRFIGLSRVPHTPWCTPREVTEEELARRLERLSTLGNTTLPLVLVAHTPPYACGLDNAPLLDRNRKQVILGGLLQTTPVGSNSLRQFLELRHDIPLGLHGHVHESAGWTKVGSTLCLNPGTEYFAGTMVGYFVHLKNGSVHHFEGVRI